MHNKVHVAISYTWLYQNRQNDAQFCKRHTFLQKTPNLAKGTNFGKWTPNSTKSCQTAVVSNHRGIQISNWLRDLCVVHTLTTLVTSLDTDMDRVLRTAARFFSALSARCSASSMSCWALRYLFMVRLATSSCKVNLNLRYSYISLLLVYIVFIFDSTYFRCFLMYSWNTDWLGVLK